jgi:hypothetical protein
MRPQTVFLTALATTLVSCASGTRPTVQVFQPIARQETIAIVPLQDCTIPNNDDCHGAGNIAASVITAVLSEGGQFKVMPLSRPVAADAPLLDDAAVALAKDKGVAFVITGEVNDFYRVAPMTFRVDRASLAFRVLAVADGKVVATAISSVESGSNLGTPEGLIRKLAEKLREQLLTGGRRR